MQLNYTNTKLITKSNNSSSKIIAPKARSSLKNRVDFLKSYYPDYNHMTVYQESELKTIYSKSKRRIVLLDVTISLINVVAITLYCYEV
jgi:hypothetical protein